MNTTHLFPDGLSLIKEDLPLIVAMVEHSARWVHPDTFRALPVWCPDTARGYARYDALWKNPLVSGRQEPKKEENVRAATALIKALGVGNPKPKNWTVCHIWGYDDENFASQSEIVKNPKYYSCIGNMVWLPTPLKGFTDTVPEIKRLLRYCAFQLYGWVPEGYPAIEPEVQIIKDGTTPNGYPESWPTPYRKTLPSGTAPQTDAVRKGCEAQRHILQRRLGDDRLERYPREQVRSVLDFWKIVL